MEKTPHHKSAATGIPLGTAAAARDKMHARASELARLAGRVPADVSQTDYQQAKREMTGETDMDRQDAILEALPESERWDPVPGSAGRQALESPSEDEDDEGRSETEQLFDEGAEAADRDKVIQAAKPSAAKHHRQR